MKAVLTLTSLCCVILTVRSACDLNSCTPASETAQSCSSIASYLECLTTEATGCTANQSQIKMAIDTTIASLDEVKMTLNCGSSDSSSGSASGSGSECSSTSCSPPATTSQTCGTLKTYLDCLNKAIGKCTSSDTIQKTVLDTAVTTATATRQALQCSGTMLTVSVSTMLISLVTYFLKL